MSWDVEWKEWDEEKQEYIVSSDIWDKWEDVVRIFNDCIQDALCCACKVTCLMNYSPYPSDDPVVLEYRL